MINNLLKKLCFYNSDDIPITGNPQITFFGLERKNFERKRHTNFSNGIITLEKSCYTKSSTDCVNLYQYDLGLPQFDLLKNIIICIKDINNIINIVITIGEQQIVLSLKYIQIYNLVAKKIIFQTNSGYMIIIPTNSYDFMYNNKSPHLYNCLPIFMLDYSFHIYTSGISKSDSDDLKLKLECVVLDTEERRRIAQLFSISNYQVYPLGIPKKNSNTFDLSEIYKNIHQNINLGIEVENFELLKSIDFVFGEHTIILSPDTLKIYGKFFNRIIYQPNQNNTVIKIKSIFNFEINPELFEIKLNYNNDMNTINTNTDANIFICNELQNIEKSSFLLFADDKMMSYFKSYSFDLADSDLGNKIKITEKYSYHMKEMFVYWTKKVKSSNLSANSSTNSSTNSSELLNIAKKITIKYQEYEDDTFTELDCQIYQQTLHPGTFDPNTYIISYSLEPKYIYPSGEINIPVGTIEIGWELKDELDKTFDINVYQMNIVIFGYRITAYKNDNFN